MNGDLETPARGFNPWATLKKRRLKAAWLPGLQELARSPRRCVIQGIPRSRPKRQTPRTSTTGFNRFPPEVARDFSRRRNRKRKGASAQADVGFCSSRIHSAAGKHTPRAPLLARQKPESSQPLISSARFTLHPQGDRGMNGDWGMPFCGAKWEFDNALPSGDQISGLRKKKLAA